MADTTVRSLDELIEALTAARAAHPEAGARAVLYDNFAIDQMWAITRVSVMPNGQVRVAS